MVRVSVDMIIFSRKYTRFKKQIEFFKNVSKFARSRKCYNCSSCGILGILRCVSFFYYNNAAFFLINITDVETRYTETNNK